MDAQLPGALLDEGVFIHLIVDAEIVPVARQMVDSLAQDLDPEGVESRYGQIGELLPREAPNPFGHLPGGFIGEGERQNSGLGDTQGEHVGNPMGNDPGFTRSRSRDYQEGPVDVLHRLLLAVVLILRYNP